MNKVKFVLLLAFSFAVGIIFSCSSDVSTPPPPLELSSSSYNSSNNATQSSSNNVAQSSSNNAKQSSSSFVSSSSIAASSSSSVQKCGGESYNQLTQRCTDDIIETKCGTDWYNAANVDLRCQSSIVETKCGSSWYNPSTQSCSGGTVYITDSRDGQTYGIVTIGTQVWMAKNLNYNATSSKCYEDNTGGDSQGNCAIYGRLYNWATAMNGATSSNRNPSGVRGICPSGFHLPSKVEWTMLISFVGNYSGTKLKSTSGWSNNGTDDYSFAALPGGYGNSDGTFYKGGEEGYWRTATEDDSYTSYAYPSVIYNVYAMTSDYGFKTMLYSVRCVQD